MHTSMRFRLGLVLALSLAATGCAKIEPLSAPATSFGSLDLTTYAAAGTSISAGFQSGGLVDRHQVRSFPAIFAQQIGKTVLLDGQGTFTLPVYDHDGFPQLYRIVSYRPLVLSNTGRVTGNAINLSQAGAYHNMAVPFAIGFDFVDTTYYYNNTVHPDVAIAYFNNIVRHTGTIAANVLSRAPTFMTWEYGSNEILGPTSVGAAASTMTAENFSPILTASLDAIHAALPNTKIAVLNVPNFLGVPIATTLSAFTVSLSTGQPVPLVGVDGPLQFGDLVLFTASTLIATTGTGIPAGGYNYLNPSVPSNGQPLPENYILRGPEIGQTLIEVTQMNLAIAAEAANRPYVAVVDLHGLLETLRIDGLTLGGTHYTTDYITGGLFSLDGAHPNDLAHAVICNALIDALNARFGASIRRVNPIDWSTPSASAARPAFPDGPALPARIDGLTDRLPRPVPDHVQWRPSAPTSISRSPRRPSRL